MEGGGELPTEHCVQANSDAPVQAKHVGWQSWKEAILRFLIPQLVFVVVL